MPMEWALTEEEQQDFDTIDPALLVCLCNSRLSEHFKAFGKELGISEPKSLEDVYKSHLDINRTFGCSCRDKVTVPSLTAS